MSDCLDILSAISLTSEDNSADAGCAQDLAFCSHHALGRRDAGRIAVSSPPRRRRRKRRPSRSSPLPASRTRLIAPPRLTRPARATRSSISYAGSSALAKQIEHGAPADIFISADLDWMDYVAKAKLIKDGTRSNMLGNRLVLIAPKSSSADSRSAKTLRWRPHSEMAVWRSPM